MSTHGEAIITESESDYSSYIYTNSNGWTLNLIATICDLPRFVATKQYHSNVLLQVLSNDASNQISELENYAKYDGNFGYRYVSFYL